jgi:hypothetical protein
MTRYAANTEVPASRSKAEIEATVERYGAQQFLSGWSGSDRAVIGFTMNDRQVKFVLQLPDRKDKAFTEYTQRGKLWARSEEAAHKLWEQATRQRWRALALVIKAKLEAVESGIAVFEDEFMANIVLPNGRLVGEEVRPAIASAYKSGKMPSLLPDYSNDTGGE